MRVHVRVRARRSARAPAKIYRLGFMRLWLGVSNWAGGTIERQAYVCKWNPKCVCPSTGISGLIASMEERHNWSWTARDGGAAWRRGGDQGKSMSSMRVRQGRPGSARRPIQLAAYRSDTGGDWPPLYAYL